MAHHDELLARALQLIHTLPPTQVTLRRGVSDAYYAVFHLLIAEATANWSNAPLRTALGRAYDHGNMKTASNRILNLKEFPFTGEDPIVVADLRAVARAFTQLQEGRHFADYDLTQELDPVEAASQVESAEVIFSLWASLRGEQIAQAYLVSLLVKRV
jgi:hypothetical protein